MTKEQEQVLLRVLKVAKGIRLWQGFQNHEELGEIVQEAERVGLTDEKIALELGEKCHGTESDHNVSSVEACWCSSPDHS